MAKCKVKRRWHSAFVGMALTLLFCCCTTEPPPNEENWPSWAPDGKRLVYECYREGPIDVRGPIAKLSEPNADLRFYKPEAADLCISEIGSGMESRLISDPGGDWRPSWSPDGNFIAYFRQDGIYLTTPEGGESRRVLEISSTLLSEREFVWSLTSDSLLFSACHEQGDYDVYILEIESSALTNLTSGRSTHDFSPMWILGGKQIAYLSADNASSSSCDVDIPAAPEIRAMNRDGTSDRVLLAPEYDYPYWYMSAANGGYIWYANQTLFRLNVEDGTVIRELIPGKNAIISPLVAPNEQRLLYQEEFDQIQMLNIRTGEVFNLIENSPDQEATLVPRSWSSDSEKFAVVSIASVDFRTNTVERIYIFDWKEQILRPLVAQDQ